MTLVFTCGDPLSVNIEAFLKAVVPAMGRHRAVVGVGSFWQLENQAADLGLQIPALEIVDTLEQVKSAGVFWVDSSPKARKVDARELSDAERGAMAVEALATIPHKLARPMAILTGPINKSTASKAGFKYPGQTEFFEDLWGSKAVMMLAGPLLRVALATNHLPLHQVANAITSNLLTRKLEILNASMLRLFKIKNPRIAVCGLNPHCGDDGLFGDEEERIIKPAISVATGLGINAIGPLPADTAFYRALQGQFDVVLAMYHDQGLGPLKTVHFDEAVNISLGLPNLRVSPDHGPASDKFLTGHVSMRSFDAALQLCERWLGGVNNA